MKRFFFCLLCIPFFLHQTSGQIAIDRKAVVDRHRIVTNKLDLLSPAQVGNGEFAFAVDITGLQTFVPFNTLSNWSWHSSSLPQGMKESDFKKTTLKTNGKDVPYDLPNPKQEQLSNWLAANPHRFNLGRIGFKLIRNDGKLANQNDISYPHQEVDLWTGIISSSFVFEGVPVHVKTACHPDSDAIGVSIESALIGKGQLAVFFAFPYAIEQGYENYLGVYDGGDQHTSTLHNLEKNSVRIDRTMNCTHYSASIKWATDAQMIKTKQMHRFELIPKDTAKLSFTCFYSNQTNDIQIPITSNLFEESEKSWKAFWNSGAAIDLSESKDQRWKELERRIVLSQYLMRLNESGSLPPQESGLVNNGWFGRFHFEMIWWHGVHYALWNRWALWDKSLSTYQNFLKTSTERALNQGYQGVRWPKCTGDIDREWPDLIHATLVWQQPHPIYFAELDYRLHTNKETLTKWRDVVLATADFMADYASYDKTKNQFDLGPPLYLVSENSDPLVTKNPTFELSYWRTGLRLAQQWRERLGMPINKKWKNVQDKLAPLPQKNGLYETYENIPDMWEKYNYEHPGLIGTYGMLPGDGVDPETFKRTLKKVLETWNFDRTWGWDFPMLAMAAARCGYPELAIDLLLHPSNNFQFDQHGLTTGGPFPYFPSNGGLLTAIAMMAGGWDGSSSKNPGFPKDGNWSIRAEGFNPLPALK